MAPIRTQWIVVGVVAVVMFLTIHTLVVQMPTFESSQSKLHGRKHRAMKQDLDGPKTAAERGGVFASQNSLRKTGREMGADEEEDADDDDGEEGNKESQDEGNDGDVEKEGGENKDNQVPEDGQGDGVQELSAENEGADGEEKDESKPEEVNDDEDEGNNPGEEAPIEITLEEGDEGVSETGNGAEPAKTEEEKKKEAQEKVQGGAAELESKKTADEEGIVIDDPEQKTNDTKGGKKGEDDKKKKMNILLMYPDDWRHDTIGGVAPVVRTPFLNELASDGIRFTHNCVTTSICWISRATLFSGQYAARHKSHLLRLPVPFVDNFNTSWAGILRDQHGYHTGHFGKWQFFHDRGVAEALFSEARFNGGHRWDANSSQPHDADIARDNALKFLDHRPKDKPFAMTVAFYPPKAIGESAKPGDQWFPKPDTMHLFVNETIPPPRFDVEKSWERLPYFFKQEWVGRDRYMQRFNTTEKYQAAMKNYYRLVYTVDEACRTLVNKLKEQGEYENTLIIFTTDNGLFHGEHGLAGKWYPFEESIRVPLIIRDPRMPKEKRNTLDDSFTLNIDLAETILGAAGVKPDPGMQGRDISDLYLKKPSSKEPWREEFYYEWLPPTMRKVFPSSTALVRKNYKYMHWPQYDYEQLFDMINDSLEENDIAKNETYADILKEMRERHIDLKAKAN